MIKTVIKDKTSFELGLLKEEQLIEVSMDGGALLLSLFDNNKQQSVTTFEPKMPDFCFNIPYESDWKLNVEFNGKPFTATEFELEIV